MIYSPEQVAWLAEVPDYRTFLKRAFELQEKSKQGFSYAGFSRKAGLASRSFPRDVVLGTKRLTAASAQSFGEALLLKGDLKQFFLLLVESAAERSSPLSAVQQKKATQKREQVRTRLAALAQQSSAETVIQHQYWFEVYAALGGVNFGASLEEVIQKTKIKKAQCESILQTMVKAKVCAFQEKSGRYFPNAPHLILNHLGQNKAFKEIFLGGLKQLQIRAEAQFESKEDLFFNSSFTIRQEKQVELKAELRELLLRFVDQNEDEHGDQVVKLTVGLLR
jgi:uncharacterized protein (TIGR02147 family)